MGSMHLKLGVLILLVAATAAIAADIKYQYYVEVDTPTLPVTNFLFGTNFFGSTRDVIIDFHDKTGTGLTRTVPGLAMPGNRTQYHTTDSLNLDPCRLTLQLTEKANGATATDLGLWIPTRVEVKVYNNSGDPTNYDEIFVFKKPVTVNCPVVINQCKP